MTESEAEDKLANPTGSDPESDDLLSLIRPESNDNHIVTNAHYKESDEQLSWMFSDDVKAGDSKIFTEVEDHYHTSGDNHDDLANIYTVVLVTRERGLVEDISSVDVRHILFSDEAEAKKVYEQWEKNGKNVEDFEKLALEHSEDPGSKFNGGLYTGVTEGQMVTEFNDWIFNKDRKQGDHGLIKTTYGWHIMYFEAGYAEWQATIKSDLLSEASQSALDAVKDKYLIVFHEDVINDIDA